MWDLKWDPVLLDATTLGIPGELWLPNGWVRFRLRLKLKLYLSTVKNIINFYSYRLGKKL